MPKITEHTNTFTVPASAKASVNVRRRGEEKLLSSHLNLDRPAAAKENRAATGRRDRYGQDEVSGGAPRSLARVRPL